MKTINLSEYGVLKFERNHWACDPVLTTAGAVDVQVDCGADLPDGIADRIVSVLDRFAELDKLARGYLAQEAPEDMRIAKSLKEPSLLFSLPEETVGEFTLFYSGEDDDDEMCYGVDFRNFTPWSLTIGD